MKVKVQDLMDLDGHLALLQALLQRRGYVVISTKKRFAPYRIGEIITEVAGFETGHPFRVMADTDAEDWLEQGDICAELRGDVTAVLGTYRTRPGALQMIAADKFQRITTD